MCYFNTLVNTVHCEGGCLWCIRGRAWRIAKSMPTTPPFPSRSHSCYITGFKSPLPCSRVQFWSNFLQCQREKGPVYDSRMVAIPGCLYFPALSLYAVALFIHVSVCDDTNKRYTFWNTGWSTTRIDGLAEPVMRVTPALGAQSSGCTYFRIWAICKRCTHRKRPAMSSSKVFPS